MSSHPRLSEEVNWTCTGVPAWRRVARQVPYVLSLALETFTAGGGSPTGKDPADPEVTMDPNAVLGLVTVKGTGAGMPSAYPAQQVVTIYWTRATISPGFTEIELPLRSMTVVGANRRGPRWTRPKDIDAQWAIRVTGSQVDLTFVGSWLMLAHLGTLGRWTEPA